MAPVKRHLDPIACRRVILLSLSRSLDGIPFFLMISMPIWSMLSLLCLLHGSCLCVGIIRRYVDWRVSRFISRKPTQWEGSVTQAVRAITFGRGGLGVLGVDGDAPFVLLDPDEDSTRGGVGDVELTTKYRLLDETERRPTFMGAVVLSLPTGAEDRGLGEKGVEVQPLVVVSKSFGPLILTVNGGYTFVTRDRDLDFWVVTGSLEYEITDAWSLVGEIVSELGTHDRGDVVVLRAGTMLAITEGIEVYTAVGFGLTGDSPDVTVRLGVTIALF